MAVARLVVALAILAVTILAATIFQFVRVSIEIDQVAVGIDQRAAKAAVRLALNVGLHFDAALFQRFANFLDVAAAEVQDVAFEMTLIKREPTGVILHDRPTRFGFSTYMDKADFFIEFY